MICEMYIITILVKLKMKILELWFYFVLPSCLHEFWCFCFYFYLCWQNVNSVPIVCYHKQFFFLIKKACTSYVIVERSGVIACTPLPSIGVNCNYCHVFNSWVCSVCCTMQLVIRLLQTQCFIPESAQDASRIML